jgi:hypothetical protein
MMLLRHEVPASCLLFGALIAGNASHAAAGVSSRASVTGIATELAATSAVPAEQATALMARWAPVFVQSVSVEHPERDRPLPIDFDGDWDATNNWAHLDADAASKPATVYGSAILTTTHAYLSYVLFYPRDWQAWLCVPYVCHDNDLETVLVVVERHSDYERLALVETKTHNRFLSLPGAAVERGVRDQPVLVVESEGHGLHALERGEPVTGPRRVFVHDSKGLPRPQANAASERYELLSLADSLWARRSMAAASGKLWTAGETGFLYYAGARFGRRGAPLGASMAGHEYPGGVRPPWALLATGERGDWFLDPAFVTHARHGAWLQPSASLDYVFNPYLDDLTRECSGAQCSSAPPPVSTLAHSSLGSGLVLALGLVSSRALRRGPARASRAAPRTPRR